MGSASPLKLDQEGLEMEGEGIGRHGGRATDKAGARDLGMDAKYASDPPVSEAQRKAMFAAKAGKSNIGIPKSVGSEFANADPGGKLPEKAHDKELDSHGNEMAFGSAKPIIRDGGPGSGPQKGGRSSSPNSARVNELTKKMDALERSGKTYEDVKDEYEKLSSERAKLGFTPEWMTKKGIGAKDSLAGQLKELENKLKAKLITKAQYDELCAKLTNPDSVIDHDKTPSEFEFGGNQSMAGRHGGRASDNARDAGIGGGLSDVYNPSPNEKTWQGQGGTGGKRGTDKQPGRFGGRASDKAGARDDDIEAKKAELKDRLNAGKITSAQHDSELRKFLPSVNFKSAGAKRK